MLRFAKSSPGSRLQLAVTPGAKKMMSNLDVSHTSPHGRSRGRPRGKCNELAATPAPLMSGKRKRVQAQHDVDWLSPKIRKFDQRGSVAVQRSRSPNLTVQQKTKLLAQYATLTKEHDKKVGVEALEKSYGRHG